MKQNSQSTVSYRSSKQEIWAAYKELKQLWEKQKKEKTAPLPVSKVDWRQSILEAVSQLEARFQKREEEIGFLQEEIVKAKEELEKLYQIKAKAQTLIDLEEKTASLQNFWQRKQKQLEEEFEQEKVWHQKRIEKEDEEERFNLELKRRRIEQEIDQKEKGWQEKEKHYQALQREVERFPKVLEREKEQISKELTVQLTKESAREKETMAQKHEAAQSLLEQEIKNWQEKAKAQEQQIKLLVNQLSEAHQRIKEMAVAALERKGPKEKSTPG